MSISQWLSGGHGGVVTHGSESISCRGLAGESGHGMELEGKTHRIVCPSPLRRDKHGSVVTGHCAGGRRGLLTEGAELVLEVGVGEENPHLT